MFVGDGIFVREDESPVDIQDLETVHFDDYSELRANIKGRRIMAHNITSKRIRDADAFKFNHRVKYEFRLPYEPIKGDSEFNPQTIEGHTRVWDGVKRRLNYSTSFQWNLNPWNANYGSISMWFGGIKRWQEVGYLEPDNLWHTFEAYLDFENSRAWISIDGVKYESELYGTSKAGLGWERHISASLVAEVISLWPGETSGGAKHRAQFRNWVWIWEPIPGATAAYHPEPTATPVGIDATAITKEKADRIKSRIGLTAEKTVIAAYMGWYGLSQGTEWKHWEWKGENPHDPRKFVSEGRRDIAAVNYPMIGPYRSNDPRLLRYHIRLARAAGIDCMSVYWTTYRYLPGIDLQYQDRNFSLMMDVADEEDYCLTVRMQPKIHFNGWVKHPSREEALSAVEDDFRYALHQYSKRKSFMKHQGLPVLFVHGTSRLTPEEWAKLVSNLEREGHYFIMVSDSPDPAYFGPFSSFYKWPCWSCVKRDGDAYFSDVLRRMKKHSVGRDDVVLAAGVWPGFDDTGVWGWGDGPRVWDRRGGESYKVTWEAALAHDARWIKIVTFNDWNEGTEIEPSIEHGFGYIEQTAEWIGKFKGVAIDWSPAIQLTNNFISGK